MQITRQPKSLEKQTKTNLLPKKKTLNCKLNVPLKLLYSPKIVVLTLEPLKVHETHNLVLPKVL